MFHFLLVFQILACVAARSRFSLDEEIFPEFFEDEVMNDPNLNPGFNLEAFRLNQLNLHNYYRAKHGVPLMSRDQTLTNQAQAYAEQLAARDRGLVHCSPNAVGCDGGENLAFAGGNINAEINATKAWYDEIWFYNFCNEMDGNGLHRPGHESQQVGHFTQVVWKGSTRLGVGYARSSDRTKVYVVARYLPAGNVVGRYSENVKRPDFILETFQDNCNGTNGNLSAWMGPGECSRSCGGGVQFLTKTCTNPKPSLNGADCVGETKQLVREWCNTHSCPGNENYRNLQCGARGFAQQSHIFLNFGECKLACRRTPNRGDFTLVGNVDDGTHCNSDSGACVDGTCQTMPLFVTGTPPPPTPPRQDTTTKEPETTTPEPKTTTPEPETTTPAPETTTPEPKTTTSEPKTTTPEPKTSTPEPKTSTPEPKTTTPEPKTTTPEPKTTTPEPKTTTPEPKTTTPEPKTTTPEPKTTTPEPKTTTPKPKTSTPEPKTTTPEPETTTSAPETTTIKPETTATAAPETTTTKPEITTKGPVTTTNTPPPAPTTQLVEGSFSRAAVAPRARFTFLTLPSGAFNITLWNSNPRGSFIRYRYQKTGEVDESIRWRFLRPRRCRRYPSYCLYYSQEPISAGYDIQLQVSARRLVRRCCRRFRRRRRCRYCTVRINLQLSWCYYRNTTTAPETTTRPETTTNAPSPPPTTQVFRSFFTRRAVAPGARFTFLTIPSGAFNVTIWNYNQRLRRTFLAYRYQKSGEVDESIRWEFIRPRRCRRYSSYCLYYFRGPVEAGYDIQMQVGARRWCCFRFRGRRRCRRCTSPINLRLGSRYYRSA